MNKWVWILLISLLVIIIGFALYTHYKSKAEEEKNRQIILAQKNADSQANTGQVNVWGVLGKVFEVIGGNTQIS